MKRKRTYDEIHEERFTGCGYMVKYPAIHTASGCRFSYVTQVDYETYDAIKARREMKAREERDRDLRIRELREKDALTEEKISAGYRKYYRAHEKELKERDRIRYKKYYEENREKILTDKKEQDEFYREKRKVLKNDESSKETN